MRILEIPSQTMLKIVWGIINTGCESYRSHVEKMKKYIELHHEIFGESQITLVGKVNSTTAISLSECVSGVAQLGFLYKIVAPDIPPDTIVHINFSNEAEMIEFDEEVQDHSIKNIFPRGWSITTYRSYKTTDIEKVKIKKFERYPFISLALVENSNHGIITFIFHEILEQKHTETLRALHILKQEIKKYKNVEQIRYFSTIVNGAGNINQLVLSM